MWLLLFLMMVSALYDEEGHKLYFAGIIAEPPSVRNNFRLSDFSLLSLSIASSDSLITCCASKLTFLLHLMLQLLSHPLGIWPTTVLLFLSYNSCGFQDLPDTKSILMLLVTRVMAVIRSECTVYSNNNISLETGWIIGCVCVSGRFMVFFDDGYAQYSAASMLHQVYDQSKLLLPISFIAVRQIGKITSLSMCHLHVTSLIADFEESRDNVFHVILSCANLFSSIYVLSLHSSTLLIQQICRACWYLALSAVPSTIARPHFPSHSL